MHHSPNIDSDTGHQVERNKKKMMPFRSPSFRLSAFFGVVLNSSRERVVLSNDNGLALTPPMGWRSWNQYGDDVSQKLMQHVMDGMVSRGRVDHTGSPISLCDLGYCDVGLDDAWQMCDAPSAAPGMHYHDVEGNPIVNTTRFPSLKSMTDHAHSLNLTAGFYGNNCICADHCRNETECEMQIVADVKAFLNWGFDSWKLDGCGGENDLALFDEHLRELSPERPIMVENCHWHWGNPEYDPNPSLPPREGCPCNFYRSSGDIGLSYQSVLHNLASVEKYREMNASVPQCWAYPDMLQVGVRRKDDGAIGLSKEETRSHFGAWCIVSSPLYLTHDVHDEEVNDYIWEIISNREAIAVNQAYDGDSGGVYETSTSMICLDEEECGPSLDTSTSRNLEASSSATVPSYQYLSKPLGLGKVAVLLVNSSSEATQLTAKFADIPGLSCDNGYCSVKNIWTHSDEGVFQESWTPTVGGHDAAFIIVECAEENMKFSSELR